MCVVSKLSAVVHLKYTNMEGKEIHQYAEKKCVCACDGGRGRCFRVIIRCKGK